MQEITPASVTLPFTVNTILCIIPEAPIIVIRPVIVTNVDIVRHIVKIILYINQSIQSFVCLIHGQICHGICVVYLVILCRCRCFQIAVSAIFLLVIALKNDVFAVALSVPVLEILIAIRFMHPQKSVIRTIHIHCNRNHRLIRSKSGISCQTVYQFFA